MKALKVLKFIAAALYLLALAFCLWNWLFQTLIVLFAIIKIKEHWETALAFFITTAASSVGGFVLIWLLHFAFTGEPLINNRSLWGVGWLFTSIYVLGLIIEEDNRAPYIWLWRQCKKIVKVSKLATG